VSRITNSPKTAGTRIAIPLSRAHFTLPRFCGV